MIRLLPLVVLAATAEAACSVAGRSNPKLRRGDETYLCVVLSSSLDWAADTKYVRLGFRAEVDTFARLEVRGAWAPLTSSSGAHHALNSTSIGLSLQSEGKRSYQRRWRDLHRGSPSTFPVSKNASRSLSPPISMARGSTMPISSSPAEEASEAKTTTASSSSSPRPSAS